MRRRDPRVPDRRVRRRSACGDSQIACSNVGGNGGESITFNPNGDTSIFVWVDGSTGAEGYYSLVLTPAP